VLHSEPGEEKWYVDEKAKLGRDAKNVDGGREKVQKCG